MITDAIRAVKTVFNSCECDTPVDAAFTSREWKPPAGKLARTLDPQREER